MFLVKAAKAIASWFYNAPRSKPWIRLTNFCKGVWAILGFNIRWFYDNARLIAKKPQQIVCFILLLPVVYYTIRLQVILGPYWFLRYWVIYFRRRVRGKENFVMDYQPVDTSNYNYLLSSLITLLINLPRSIGFNFFYISLQRLKKDKGGGGGVNLGVGVALALSYALNLSIINYLGYSLATLLVTSRLVIKLFSLLRLKYSSVSALYQHVMLNCIIIFPSNISLAYTRRVYLNEDGITFNPGKRNPRLLKKSDVDLLAEIIRAEPRDEDLVLATHINDHYTYLITGLNADGTPLSVGSNLTSSKYVNILDHLGNPIRREVDPRAPNYRGNAPHGFAPLYTISNDAPLNEGRHMPPEHYANRGRFLNYSLLCWYNNVCDLRRIRDQLDDGASRMNLARARGYYLQETGETMGDTLTSHNFGSRVLEKTALIKQAQSEMDLKSIFAGLKIDALTGTTTNFDNLRDSLPKNIAVAAINNEHKNNDGGPLQ